MIVAKHIIKTFNGKNAVDDISFEVKEGETLVLLGTSGCGKTTTLRMLNRLAKPTSGRISINGKDAATIQPETLRKGMGYVLQGSALFPHYTVAENIGVVPALLKWNKEEIKERTHQLLEKIHLPYDEFAHKYPHTLSGGQQQRIGLARALAADPPIMLMDEPFGALDPVTRATVRKEIMQLDELKKKTIVLVTHDVQEAFELGDIICIMNKGKIMQIGTKQELLYKPANEFVSSFLQHERLSLQLKSLKLSAIWDAIANVNDENDLNDNNAVSIDENIWNIMELLSSKNDKIFFASDTLTGIKKRIDSSVINLAYNYIKKQ